MWFFTSVQLLPRPTVSWLLALLFPLAVWGLLGQHQTVVFGQAVQPLWLVIASGMLLGLSRRLPQNWAQAKEGDIRATALVIYAGILVLLVSGAFVQSAFVLQLAWLIAQTLYTLLCLLVLLRTPEDTTILQTRWSGDHPFAETAGWIQVTRQILVILLLGWLALYGTLTDWVLVFTLGRIVFYYVGEWVTILFALTSRRKDEGGEG